MKKRNVLAFSIAIALFVLLITVLQFSLTGFAIQNEQESVVLNTGQETLAIQEYDITEHEVLVTYRITSTQNTAQEKIISVSLAPPDASWLVEGEQTIIIPALQTAYYRMPLQRPAHSLQNAQLRLQIPGGPQVTQTLHQSKNSFTGALLALRSPQSPSLIIFIILVLVGALIFIWWKSHTHTPTVKHTSHAHPKQRFIDLHPS